MGDFEIAIRIVTWIMQHLGLVLKWLLPAVFILVGVFALMFNPDMAVMGVVWIILGVAIPVVATLVQKRMKQNQGDHQGENHL